MSPMNLFCVGAALAALSGFTTWFAFLILTMMMDPSLQGAHYWVEVRERMSANPATSVLMGLSFFGTLAGLGMMAKALMKWLRPTQKHGFR